MMSIYADIQNFKSFDSRTFSHRHAETILLGFEGKTRGRTL
jgi:hypothetical protein